MKRVTLFALLLGAASVGVLDAQENSRSPHGNLRTELECTACHSTGAWKPMRPDAEFNHGKATGFALEGKHASTSCGACHSGLRYDKPRARASECASCHVDVHQGRLGASCSSCHNTTAFSRAANASAHARTAFPLTGVHAQVPCASCHRNEREGEYTRLETSCNSCHRADYEATAAPSHSAVGFPVGCQQCHSTARWNGVRFDHASKGFALEGAHARTPCGSCHLAGGALVGRPAQQTDCMACHRPDYQREHAAQKFPETCLRCHTQNTWSTASFNHASVARGFALQGAHAAIACTSCHAADFKPIVVTTANDCVGCHQADYQREHNGSGFPSTCLTCHTTNQWKGARFDHAASARGFDLQGAHIRATCGACHTPDGKTRFKAASQNDCVSCHRPDYDRKHANTTIPTTCITCHNVERWTGAILAHTKFPLVGVHALPCSSCHAPDNRLIFPTPAGANDCVACHRSDYDRQHAGSGFPTTCTSCHTNGSWTGAVFNHATVANGYVLVGVHAQKPCSACHAPGGQKLFTPSNNQDCVSCHRPDYDRAHTGSSYPLSCAGCHPQTTWKDGQFDHDRQFFPIYSGSHQGKWSSCAQCHPSPASYAVFTCTSCHTRTKTDGDHRQVANYVYDSVRCLACHPRGN